MEKIQLEILTLSPSQFQAGSFTMILEEVDGNRRLPIIIGLFEAQAIAIELEQLSPSRPLTHDLFVSFAKSFEFQIDEIHIFDIQEGIFYSRIYCTDRNGRQKSIEARPSDAVAIALRFNAPIFTNETVLSLAGISEEDEGGGSSKAPKKEVRVKEKNKGLSGLSLEELNKSLADAIAKEEYEQAARIRDEIGKRN